MPICSDCDVQKPDKDFVKNRSRPNGLDSLCKPCKLRRSTEWVKKEKTRHKTLPVSKRCSGCGETKPSEQFYKNKASRSGLTSRCKPCEDAGTKLTRTESTYRYNMYSKNWNAKNKQLGYNTNWTVETAKYWFSRQIQYCYYCKFTGKLTVDRKDNNEGYFENNMVLACWTCNRVKSAILTEEEMIWLGPRIRARLETSVTKPQTKENPSIRP